MNKRLIGLVAAALLAAGCQLSANTRIPDGGLSFAAVFPEQGLRIQAIPSETQAIAVAVSDGPTGPFVDARGSALITNDMTPKGTHSWEDIDPTVFTDDDGTTWIAWGNRQAYIARLKPSMIEIDGPITDGTAEPRLSADGCPRIHHRTCRSAPLAAPPASSRHPGPEASP